MKKTLVSRHQDMMALLHLDLSEISVVQKEKSCLAVVPVEQELPTAADVEQVIGAVKRYSLQRLHDAVYGSMIAVDQLHQGSYDRYEALYVELPRLSTQKGLHIRPGGQYLRAFCKGSWDNLPGRGGLVYVQTESAALVAGSLVSCRPGVADWFCHS